MECTVFFLLYSREWPPRLLSRWMGLPCIRAVHSHWQSLWRDSRLLCWGRRDKCNSWQTLQWVMDKQVLLDTKMFVGATQMYLWHLSIKNREGVLNCVAIVAAAIATLYLTNIHRFNNGWDIVLILKRSFLTIFCWYRVVQVWANSI